MANRDDWGPLLRDLEERRADSRSMGGHDKLQRYRASGGVDARERIARLLDTGTFTEIGLLAGAAGTPADAFIAGSGLIEGRPVFIGAEDFSVAGGSIGTAAATKRARIAALAGQQRAPLVLMLEGAGHRATNMLEAQRPAPNDLQMLADLSGQVPIVAIVTGPSAGHGALAAPLSDFVVMVEGRGSLFTAGPPLVQAATGEQVTKETLGGPQVHTVVSGVAHNVAADADEALRLARRYLSYFPSHAGGTPPSNADFSDGPRPVEALLDLIPPDPRLPYDMVDVLRELVDRESLLQVQPDYGASIITALARLGGHAVAVVASQPAVRAGAIDTAGAEKAARFIATTSAFGLPLVQLADNPGVLSGSASERAGVLRAAARMFTAQRSARVPKFHVTIRKAFGFGSSVMGQNAFDGQTVSLAFPGATLGGIPAAVGGATSKADEATQHALVEHEMSGPWTLARTATYDDIIDPRDLRSALLTAVERSWPPAQADSPARSND